MKEKLYFSLAALSLFLCTSQVLPAGDSIKKVLCTTFPVYQVTRNVTEGVPGIQVELMIPARLGCPHNYSLTPDDMRKIASAETLVINGAGMEEFLGAPLLRANPEIITVDSSEGIGELLEFGHHEPGGHDGDKQNQDEKENDPEAEDHGHGGVNPHLFASPGMAAKMTMNIAEGLSRTYPEAAGKFRENGRRYASELELLAVEFSDLAGKLGNNRIVTQHGAFDYLARDAGLEIVAVISDEGGDSLSAASIIRLVKKIRQTMAGAVFTEPQYPGRIGRVISAETGIPAGELDPVASGPADAPLNYYELVMRRNIQTLETLLGGRK